MNIKKFVISASTAAIMLSIMAIPVLAAVTPGAAVKNENANQNACWGMDRAYYASMGYFSENMDIKQSFPIDVGTQLQDWVATYCEAHGPVAE
jgi:hypothetical protein